MEAVNDQLSLRSVLFYRRNVCLTHIGGDSFNRFFTAQLPFPKTVKAFGLLSFLCINDGTCLHINHNRHEATF